jgi:hypothetical protein
MAPLNSCVPACGSNQGDDTRQSGCVLFALGIESDVYGPGGTLCHQLRMLPI